MSQISLFSEQNVKSFSELDSIEAKILKCDRCSISKSRNNPICGAGLNSNPDLFLIGTAPTSYEDHSGKPFTGPAGRFLFEHLEKFRFNRKNTFAAYLLRCYPEGREPTAREIANCAEYLVRQLSLVKPKVILAFGKLAAQTLVGKEYKSVESVRNNWYSWDYIPVRATYLPEQIMHKYLIESKRLPSSLVEFHADLKAVRTKVDEITALKKRGEK